MKTDSTIQNNSILGWLAGKSYRHARWVLFSILMLGFISLWFARKLTLDADIAALLPETFSSVQDLESAKQRFGGFGYVVVVASGSDPVQLRRFADEIEPKLALIENVQFVANKRTNEFFRNRALYYLQVEDLKTIYDRVNERWKWEKRQRNPLFIDLEGEEAPSIDMSDIKEKYSVSSAAAWVNIQQSHDDYYVNKDKNKIAVFIKPISKVTNLEFSKKVLQDVQRVVDAMPISSYGISDVELTGRYKKQIDLQLQVQKDLAQASVLAILLVVIYLYLHFRKFSALIYISFPLAIGIFWTLALAYFIFEQLNVITGFIGVILLGLGIDHGIHLYSRYRAQLIVDNDPEAAVTRTFSSTGRAVTLAALTTLTSFVALAISDFRAFHEFGVIAAIGMFFIVMAYTICLPALLRVMVFNKNGNQQTTSKSQIVEKYVLQLNYHRNRIILLGLGITIILLLPAKNVQFNYDFESLSSGDLKSFLLDKEVNQLLGHSQTPMIAMTQGEGNEKYVIDQLRQNYKSENGMQFVLGVSDLVPMEQVEKSQVMADIRKIINKININNLNEKDADNVQTLKRQTNAVEFDATDLPPQISALLGLGLEAKNESQQGSILLSPSVSLSDGQAVRKLADELRELRQADGSRVPIAGETMILADIMNQIFAESPKVFSVSALIIFAMLWFSLKSLRYALLCFTFSLLTIVMTFGVMSIFGIELNYINVLILPVLLGLSVDSGVHLITRALEGDDLMLLLNETGMAIVGSVLTSIFGMLGLVLADHQGLSSLGLVCIIGLLINTILSFSLLAVLLPTGKLNVKKA